MKKRVTGIMVLLCIIILCVGGVILQGRKMGDEDSLQTLDSVQEFDKEAWLADAKA